MILLYQAVQIIYWLVLAVWLGCMIFLVVGAPVVFKVVRRLEVRSGRYADPALDDEQTTIVAGEIVGGLLARCGQVQMLCASALLPLMIVQFFLIDLQGTNLIAAMVRLVLWLLTTVVLLYEWRWHYPRTWQLRQEYLRQTEDPEAASTARDAFEREHRRSEQLFLLSICLLVGLLMMSANVTPRATQVIAPANVER